jgi:glutathione S-transferase
MITLYQFEPAFGLPNASPFCLKLETWLRMAGLPYEAPRMTLSAMGRSPKGKLPYIVDGEKTIADSSFIVDYLTATYGVALDGWLIAGQRAQALAFQRLMEENLYWGGGLLTLAFTRWLGADPRRILCEPSGTFALDRPATGQAWHAQAVARSRHGTPP